MSRVVCASSGSLGARELGKPRDYQSLYLA